MRSKYLLGTRGSALARRQAELIRESLAARYVNVGWEIMTIASSGDRQSDTPLAAMAGEGIFVKELEQALLRGDIDLAVHSLKDLPLTGTPSALMTAAIPERVEPHDALVSRDGSKLADLPRGARVASSSLRRQSQLLHVRPDLAIVPIRGNVDTRLKKLESEELDGVVLAAAGLIRLGLQDRISELLQQLVPEPGQGALAVQVRCEDRGLRELVESLDHVSTRTAVEAERSLLAALGGGCRVPIGALGTMDGTTLTLQGIVASPDGTRVVRDAISGPATDAARLGRQLAEQLSALGAREILADVGRS